MGSATDTIQDVEVVGKNSRLKQTCREPHQYLGIIVDALQQNRLIEQRDTGIAQLCASGSYVRVYLVRMVDMEDKNNRHAQVAEPVRQSGIDSRWQDYRLPGVNSQALNVRYTLESVSQTRQAGITQ
jgi:hypothetical protein